ncbi:MAG: ribonuclease III [Chloroflexota bacterium]
MTEQEQVKAYQEHIGLRFLDPNLLQRALTHRSFVNEVEEEIRDNERLEFLGDAILDFIVADMLFRRFPDISEGDLTQLRAALVRTDSLAILSREIDLGEYLFMGKGEENSGGRTRVNNLCRGYEALIGAIYMDQGTNAVRQFIMPSLNALLDYVLENDLHKDARSMLQERSQADLQYTPFYRLKESIGPDHEREFVNEVVIAGIVIGEGSGTSKRAAAQDAARLALKKIDIEGWSEEVVKAARLHVAIENTKAERKQLAQRLGRDDVYIAAIVIEGKMKRFDPPIREDDLDTVEDMN